MSDEIETLIEETIALKRGDKTYLLTKEGEWWLAAIGNRSAHVSIGENLSYGTDGVDVFREGSTVLEAVAGLRNDVKQLYT